MELPLAGQLGIVTGASRDRGIGAAICRALAAKGANVFFTVWRPYDRLMPWREEEDFPERLTEELRNRGVQADWVEIDLSSMDGPISLIRHVAERLGTANILVNNACYSVHDTLESIDASLLDRSYAVNVRAPILLSVEFTKHFGRRGARRIISLTSGQFRGPMRGELAYAVTKASVDAFTITFAAEAGPLGITVNAVDPGPSDTGWLTEPLAQELSQRIPAGRVGHPADAANLVAFLATAEAGWINGQVLHSDGGFS